MLHTGHEFIFCMRGNIDFEVDEQHYQLQQGDSLLFTAQLVHRWRNPGQTVANIIIVISGFEESERPVEFHMASTHAIDGEDKDAHPDDPPEFLREV